LALAGVGIFIVVIAVVIIGHQALGFLAGLDLGLGITEAVPVIVLVEGFLVAGDALALVALPGTGGDHDQPVLVAADHASLFALGRHGGVALAAALGIGQAGVRRAVDDHDPRAALVAPDQLGRVLAVQGCIGRTGKGIGIGLDEILTRYAVNSCSPILTRLDLAVCHLPLIGGPAIAIKYCIGVLTGARSKGDNVYKCSDRR
jgi:hypothetical protein